MAAGPARAGEIGIAVTDESGAPVKDAVVSLMSADPALNKAPDAANTAVMTQRGKEFRPHVLPVRTGTTVRFPNQDDFRHQIYSFSKPKTFEISLYSGEEGKRETFDKPGVVALGCNIHDNMLGYIYVLGTDHYAATGSDGTARVGGLGPGKYNLALWHLRQRGAEISQEVTVADGPAVTLQLTLSLKPAVAPPGATP
ncbi:MAG: methylamine utilization protein [Sphingomonadales bacterium]